MANIEQQNTVKISPIKAFTDNYIWAMHNQDELLVVDPGDAKPVLAYIEKHGLTLHHILITHHHYDHTGGVADLLARFPEAKVYGPHNRKIADVKYPLAEGDTLDIPNLNVTFDILETPGHTMDHIVFVNKDFVFCGDTLFSAGCGRMFEGTPEVFYHSLQKLANLPSHTKVYCTHEYTQANLKFAQHVDANNKDLSDYAQWVQKQREQDLITLPSTIKKERAINPFLRCHIIDINNMDNIKNHARSDIDTFASLRALKDNF